MKKLKLLKLFLLTLLTLNIIIPMTYSYPKPIGYVNDFANIIDAEYEQSITQLITDIEKNTSAEVAVVTINSLEGESIENYAVKLFKDWGIGKKEEDNGLLILVALKERRYRIEVGYGLEGSINDARAGRIARAYLTPNFKHGNYGKGIYKAILALKPYITGEPVEQEVSQEQVFGFFGLIAFSIVYGIILFLYLIKVNKTKKKKRKKILITLPWIIPFLPLIILFFFLSFMLFLTTFFVYLAFASYVFGPRLPRQRYFGPFGGFGGGIGGFRTGGRGRGGGFRGFGGGSSGGGGFSGGW